MIMHLRNRAVNQRLQTITVTGNAELSTSTQRRSREQNVFDKDWDLVLLDNFGYIDCFADFPGDGLEGSKRSVLLSVNFSTDMYYNMYDFVSQWYMPYLDH